MDMLYCKPQRLKFKKGFTLVELLAVIAIIAVLVLIAAPSFLGNKEKAQLANIKADVKTAQLAVGRHLLEHETLAEKGGGTSKVGFPIYTESEEITPYNTKGKFEGDVNSGGPLHDISSIIDSSLNKKGAFVGNDKGEVFYLAKGKSNLGSNIGVGGEETNVKPIPNPEKDFEWIPDTYGYEFKDKTENGYWKYKGDTKEVVIPEKINGETLTSYYMMFAESSVTKVTSSNEAIIDMNNMFTDSKANSLNLRDLNTSNVTNMSNMFAGSQAISIDLRKFDTAKVADMSQMFYRYGANSLDLSAFDTSNVTDMSNMFQFSSVVVVQTKTQEDALRLNNSTNKPGNINFTIDN